MGKLSQYCVLLMQNDTFLDLRIPLVDGFKPKIIMRLVALGIFDQKSNFGNKTTLHVHVMRYNYVIQFATFILLCSGSNGSFTHYLLPPGADPHWTTHITGGVWGQLLSCFIRFVQFEPEKFLPVHVQYGLYSMHTPPHTPTHTHTHTHTQLWVECSPGATEQVGSWQTTTPEEGDECSSVIIISMYSSSQLVVKYIAS